MKNIDHSVLSEKDLKILAQQLRKPEGELGKQVGERMNISNAAMNLHSIAVLNAGPNDNILEIGMGNGFFVKNILSLHPSIRYTGYDYSQDMISLSEKRNRKWVDDNRASFIHGDISETTLTPSSFTKIFTVNTIYFWKDVQQVLKTLKSLLKLGGELILAFRPEENMKNFPVTQYNFNFFRKERVMEELKQVGFSSIQYSHIYEPEEVLWGKEIVKEIIIVKALNA